MSGKTEHWPSAVDSAAAEPLQSQHVVQALELKLQVEISWALQTMVVKPLWVAGWVLAMAWRAAGFVLVVAAAPLVVLHWAWTVEAGMVHLLMALC